MVLRSALAHRLQNHVWIRGSASNHYLQIPARLRLQFSSVARSTSFCVLFAALSLTEVTDRDSCGSCRRLPIGFAVKPEYLVGWVDAAS